MTSIPGATHLRKPTDTLLPIRSIKQTNTGAIQLVNELLKYISNLYFPIASISAQDLHAQIGSASPKAKHHPIIEEQTDSGYASANDTSQELVVAPEWEDVHDIQCDAYERAFVVQWLTQVLRFVSEQDECWSETVESTSHLLSKLSSPGDDETVNETLALTRSFSFRVNGGRDPDVQAILNDEPLSDTDHTSVGLQSWGSAVVFASMMCAQPSKYLTLSPRQRVLELGAGTGLLSIVSAKLLSNPLEIVATDYHADVLDNLRANIRTNFPLADSGITTKALDWSHYAHERSTAEEGAFDVILAADVIYAHNHAEWIHACVTHFLRQSADSVFWLIVPARQIGRHEGMIESVDRTFPPRGTEGGKFMEQRRLVLQDRRRIERKEGVRIVGANVGRADEDGWVLWKIGWNFE